MEEIKINDKVYVPKEELDKVKPVVNQRGIMDAANVMMFLKLEDSDFKGDESQKYKNITLNKPDLEFKHNGELDECTMDFKKEKVITKVGTLISYEYVMMADKLVKAMTYKPKKGMTEFTVYEGFKNEKEYMKDYPVCLVSNGLAFIIAPRILE